MINAYSLKALPALGINPATLGCVMLDVAPVNMDGIIPDDWAYQSKHPERQWISGVQTGAPHITLLYGLLANAHTIREHVDEVLTGWEPDDLAVQAIDRFPSPFPDESYVCMVGLLRQINQQEPWSLLDAHRRLSFLPHVNTHAVYKAHVTLAYVHRRYADAAETLLRARLPQKLTPIGLNYGYEPEGTAV